jgi:hypothetical protein
MYYLFVGLRWGLQEIINIDLILFSDKQNLAIKPIGEFG